MPKLNIRLSPDVAPTLLQDSIFWGIGALLSVIIAISSVLVGDDNQSQTLAEVENLSIANEIDTMSTGSIDPSGEPDKELSRQEYPEFGTTVAVRNPDIDWADNSDKTDDQVIQFGIDLGASRSFSALGKRYRSMISIAPTLFSNLEPRASIIDIENGIEARLIAGPFADRESAIRQCSKIRQRINTRCSPTSFVGRPINRN